jgi:hypothetical protein
MARNLSLLARLPRLEEDGVTHRRDCECVRCDAGFGPSEHDRAEARRRFEARRAREHAARALERSQERTRMKQAMKQAETDGYVDAQVKLADEQVRALREAQQRAAHDQRLAELLRLREAGLSLEAALEQVEQHGAPAAAADE